MLLVRLPVFPDHAQVCVGDSKSTDTPEWDDDPLVRGVAASASELLIATAEPPGYVLVDVRDGSPPAEAAVVFEGCLRIDRTLSIGAVSSPAKEILVLPGGGDWRVMVTVDDPEAARHVTVWLPEFADVDMPDGVG
jgi:hypothetical protein